MVCVFRLMLAAFSLVALGYLAHSPAVAEALVGKASYYRHGQVTASGETFKPNGLTAAHRTLKFGTRVLVTHLKTGRSVVVTINDRGPFSKGRIIDLSVGAARIIGLEKSGVSLVKLVVLPSPQSIAEVDAPRRLLNHR